VDNATHRLDAIDDELEIGFDQKFEKKWRKLEIGAIGLWCCLCWRHWQACSGEARSATAPIKRPTGAWQLISSLSALGHDYPAHGTPLIAERRQCRSIQRRSSPGFRQQ
jgi:hypothetical protein